MQFSKLLIAAAAFAVAQALVQFDNTVYNNVTAGMSYTLTWSNAVGPVTLTLKNGAATDLQTVNTIASGLSGTSYTWAVPSTLTADTYAFEITDGTTTNYSPQFQLLDGAAATSTASSASSTGSSSTASSTSGSSTTSASSSASTTVSSSSRSTSSSTRASSTSSSTSRATSATAATSPTSAPGSAAGLESPLAFVFLALAAFFTLN